MPERENLQRWLVTGARRERLDRLLRASGSCACIAAATWLLWQGAHALHAHPHVIAALLPLLILCALGACVYALLPAVRRIDARQAARLADARAGLHDQLTSAQWLGTQADAHPNVELLLHRAQQTVQRIDAARVFPLRPPLRFGVAFALGGCALALAMIASTQPQLSAPVRAANEAARLKATQPAAATARGADQDTPMQAGEATRASDALAAQVESLASALGGDADLGALRAALAKGDRAAAARQAQALARKVETERSGPLPEQEDKMNAEVAASILERLQQLLREQTDPASGPPKQANAVESTAQLTRQLRQEMSVSPPPAPTEHLGGEPEVDRNVRVLARSNPDGRSAVAGDGEAEGQGGNARLSGGAMGRRVGQSRAGAGDGDQDANANPEGTAQAGDVLGRRTQRLQTQLQQVRVERDEAQADADAPEDARFVLTQWESAQRAYAEVQARARRSAEHSAERPETPLAWRESVKRYSLSQHRRDAAQRPQAEE